MAMIDVIVPCYGYGGYLTECVESVLQQSGVDVRVLIIDDASPDNTAEVAERLAKEDERVSVISHTRNHGHIDTYNEGLDWASAPYGILLSADDYLLPNSLARAIDLMEAHPEVVMTHGRALRLDDNQITEWRRRESLNQLSSVASLSDEPWRILTGAEFIRKAGSLNPVDTPTAVFRNAIQKRIGGYRNDLPHAADMEMWFRFAAHGAIGEILVPQAIYRQHRRAMSKSWYTHFDGLVDDLRQREQTFRILSSTFGPNLPEWESLVENAMRLLAEDALGLADRAFMRGDLKNCHRLLGIATGLSADVVGSREWRRLARKRLLGPRIYKPVARLRQGDILGAAKRRLMTRRIGALSRHTSASG